MSFFLKQAINALTTERSDLQNALDLKANAAQTYTMNDVNQKFTDLILRPWTHSKRSLAP